ncbi:ATP-binding protein [Frankia sp. Cpl3]|uniref:ATP-binding protein n=1 Tax=Parafrankia colletiae TaxID=573497 RepID=UPI000B16D91C|nr:ATP-binding protein [Parafrankia colletiae]MCK9903033.1 ATP-binding protein [Frankia sp. Cpl3]
MRGIPEHGSGGGGLPAPAVSDAAVTRLPFTADNLLAARRQVLVLASRAGVLPQRAADLKLALHEILTNSVRHGGGGGVLRVWVEEAMLICEVSDRGHVRDMLAGRRPPALDAEGGRGLWLAHQLCDLVQLSSSPAGTIVRLHCRIESGRIESGRDGSGGVESGRAGAGAETDPVDAGRAPTHPMHRAHPTHPAEISGAWPPARPAPHC